MATDTSNFNFQGIGIVNLVDGGSGGPGCMDQNANNYNPAATEDDGSCDYDSGGPGCTNPNAFNYNPAATSDDDSCVFDPGGGGCTDALAVNYNSTATTDDGSCIYVEIEGCMDPLATNYDANANVSSDTCEYYVEVDGCIDLLACNYDPLANTDDGSCIFPDGCTNPGAPNYDPNAQCDDGSCEGGPGEWGCTDLNACNYNPSAVNDDENCDYSCFGCADDGEKSFANGDDFDSMYPGNEACNYDPAATVNDGSCEWNICCPDKNYLNGTPEDEECCSFDQSTCQIKKVPGCMDDGGIRYDNVNFFGRICVMDPGALYDYTLPDGTVINADANGIIAADPDGWPGAGNGDHPDFVNQSNCITTLYTNNGGGDPSAAGIGSFTPGTPALNYDPFATVDDGSCRYKEEEIIRGCLDDKACNYDCVYGNTNYPCNDGVTTNVSETCIYPTPCRGCDGRCKDGCMQVYGDFCFGEDAGSDKGCCVSIVEGCKDQTANNFNCETGSTSTTPCIGANLGQTVNVQDDPSSCIYTDFGCTDPLADNYDSTANIDDASCIYTIHGCMDDVACNYDSSADVDDGSCCYGICGCMDATAINYDATAECDDGSCGYLMGCTDPMANNYSPTAIVDYGCVYCGKRSWGCSVIPGMGYHDLQGNYIEAAGPMDGFIDSGYRILLGKTWGGPQFEYINGVNTVSCPGWEYFVSNGLQDEFIRLHYAVDAQPPLNPDGDTTGRWCIANPADFGGELRRITTLGAITITNANDYYDPSAIVYTGQAHNTTINDVINWLNTNVANVFSNTMTYEEVNQEYKNQTPSISWDELTRPIRVGQSYKRCCEGGLNLDACNPS